MKVGDLVRWLGFNWQNRIDKKNKEEMPIGIVVKIWNSPYNKYDERINVIWGGGNYGKGLYPHTVEVINEVR